MNLWGVNVSVKASSYTEPEIQQKKKKNFVENLKLRIYIRCVQGILCFWFCAVIWLHL